MNKENVVYTEEGECMIEVARYIINTTKEHVTFYNVVREYIRMKDNVQTDYVSILDSILGVAYRMSNGDTQTKSFDDLEYEIVNEYFSQTLPQEVLNSISQHIASILEYYCLALINLKIGFNRVMFLNDVNANGITIAEYNIEHLSDKE